MKESVLALWNRGSSQKNLQKGLQSFRSSEYAEKCELLRKYFPNPALTTDVIVGFPGETEEEFKESYDFVDSIDFYETHIFKYSRREGTKAAVMPDQVDEQIKAKRSAQLIELGEKKRAAYEQSFQGKEVEVLVEWKRSTDRSYERIYENCTRDK